MICRIALTLAAIAVLTASACAEQFVLPAESANWRCPFERAGTPPPPPPGNKGPVLPEPDDASILTTTGIMGTGDELTATVSGVKVRAGDKIKGRNLTFNVEKITKDAVHMKVVEAKEKHKQYIGRVYIKKIAN